jgi:adenylosuccinate synthase
VAALERARPVLETLPGFEAGPLSGCARFEELPERARAYVEEIERRLGVPVEFVSTGPSREQMIARRASAWT